MFLKQQKITCIIKVVFWAGVLLMRTNTAMAKVQIVEQPDTQATN